MPGSVAGPKPDMPDEDGASHGLEPKNQTGKRRLSRNESEKLRRDKLNMHIAELAKLVPIVAAAPRKLDKSSVLRLSVNYLRMHNEIKKSKEFELWRPEFLTQENLGAMLLEVYDGFLLVISQKGIILYVSDLITTYLGHSQMDLLGQSVYQLVHPDDVALCREQFQIGLKPKQYSMKTLASRDNQGDPNDSPLPLSDVYCFPGKDRRSFHLRMVNLSNKDQRTYELINLTCHVRSFIPHLPTDPGGTSTVVVGVGRLARQQPIHELNVLPSTAMEFVTQHSMDGNIIYTNHQQSVCMGRLPREICGKSAYEFIVPEDLIFIHYSHQKVLKEGAIPSTVFRSYTKSGKEVCLQAHSTICCDNWTKLPKYILSNNVIISETEFKVLLNKQRAEISEMGFCDERQAPSTDSSDDSDPAEDCAKKQRMESSPAPSWNSQDADGAPDTPSQDRGSLPVSSDSNPSQSPISAPDRALLPGGGSSHQGGGVTSGPKTGGRVHNNNNSSNNNGRASCESLLNPNSANSSAGVPSNVKDGSILANLLYGPCSEKEKDLPQERKDESLGEGEGALGACTNELNTSTACSPTAHLRYSNTETSLECETMGTSSAQANFSPKSSQHVIQLDLRTAMAQSQLSKQLQVKYSQLEISIEQQESELQELRQHMIKYLLSNPDVQQAYLKRLQILESKRQQHQITLKRLQDIHDSQQKTLLQSPSAAPARRTSCTATLESARTSPMDEPFLESADGGNSRDTHLPHIPLTSSLSDPLGNSALSSVDVFRESLFSLAQDVSSPVSQLNLSSTIPDSSSPSISSTCPAPQLKLSPNIPDSSNPSLSSTCSASQLSLSSTTPDSSNPSLSSTCPASQLSVSSNTPDSSSPSLPSACPASQLSLSSNIPDSSSPSLPSTCPVSQLSLSSNMPDSSNPSLPSTCPASQLSLSSTTPDSSNPSLSSTCPALGLGLNSPALSNLVNSCGQGASQLNFSLGCDTSTDADILQTVCAAPLLDNTSLDMNVLSVAPDEMPPCLAATYLAPSCSLNGAWTNIGTMDNNRSPTPSTDNRDFGPSTNSALMS